MSTQEQNTSLASMISSAIKIPGVTVNRSAFLCEAFKNENDAMRNRMREL